MGEGNPEVTPDPNSEPRTGDPSAMTRRRFGQVLGIGGSAALAGIAGMEAVGMAVEYFFDSYSPGLAGSAEAAEKNDSFKTLAGRLIGHGKPDDPHGLKQALNDAKNGPDGPAGAKMITPKPGELWREKNAAGVEFVIASATFNWTKTPQGVVTTVLWMGYRADDKTKTPHTLGSATLGERPIQKQAPHERTPTPRKNVPPKGKRIDV